MISGRGDDGRLLIECTGKQVGCASKKMEIWLSIVIFAVKIDTNHYTMYDNILVRTGKPRKPPMRYL